MPLFGSDGFAVRAVRELFKQPRNPNVCRSPCIVFVQGVRLALVRMALEMQACLPTHGAAVKQQSPTTTTTTTTTIADGEAMIARRVGHQGSLDAVQREHGRVSTAAFLLKRHLFRHQGTVSAALVLGGVDTTGAHLYQVGFKATVDQFFLLCVVVCRRGQEMVPYVLL